MIHTSPDPAGQDWTRLLTSDQRLRILMVACRVRFTWFGVEKALTPEQNARAAQGFETTPQFLRAAKRLLDVHHPAFRALTSLRGQIEAYWRGLTLPFPEPCLRLIRLDQVEAFDRQMNSYRMQLGDAATDLERNIDRLKDQAVRQLGLLFDPADYPAAMHDLFGCRWDFPNLEPPSNLTWLSPTVHQREEFRVQTLYEEAVRLTEQRSSANSPDWWPTSAIGFRPIPPPALPRSSATAPWTASSLSSPGTGGSISEPMTALMSSSNWSSGLWRGSLLIDCAIKRV